MEIVVNSLERGKNQLTSMKKSCEIEIRLSDHYFIIEHIHENYGKTYTPKEYIIREWEDKLVILPREFASELIGAGKKNSRCKVKIKAIYPEEFPELNFYEEKRRFSLGGVMESFFPGKNPQSKEVKRDSHIYREPPSSPRNNSEERKFLGRLKGLGAGILIFITVFSGIKYLEIQEKRRADLVRDEREEIGKKIREYEENYGVLEAERLALEKKPGLKKNSPKNLAGDEVWDMVEKNLVPGVELEKLEIMGKKADITGRGESLRSIYDLEKRLLARGFTNLNSDYLKEEERGYSFRIDIEIE